MQFKQATLNDETRRETAKQDVLTEPLVEAASAVVPVLHSQKSALLAPRETHVVKAAAMVAVLGLIYGIALYTVLLWTLPPNTGVVSGWGVYSHTPLTKLFFAVFFVPSFFALSLGEWQRSFWRGALLGFIFGIAVFFSSAAWTIPPFINAAKPMTLAIVVAMLSGALGGLYGHVKHTLKAKNDKNNR